MHECRSGGTARQDRTDWAGRERTERERNQCREGILGQDPLAHPRSPDSGSGSEDGRAISGNILHDYPSPTQKELGLRETRGP